MCSHKDVQCSPASVCFVLALRSSFEGAHNTHGYNNVSPYREKSHYKLHRKTPRRQQQQNKNVSTVRACVRMCASDCIYDNNLTSRILGGTHQQHTRADKIDAFECEVSDVFVCAKQQRKTHTHTDTRTHKLGRLACVEGAGGATSMRFVTRIRSRTHKHTNTDNHQNGSRTHTHTHTQRGDSRATRNCGAGRIVCKSTHTVKTVATHTHTYTITTTRTNIDGAPTLITRMHFSRSVFFLPQNKCVCVCVMWARSRRSAA